MQSLSIKHNLLCSDTSTTEFTALKDMSEVSSTQVLSWAKWIKAQVMSDSLKDNKEFDIVNKTKMHTQGQTVA